MSVPLFDDNYGFTGFRLRLRQIRNPNPTIFWKSGSIWRMPVWLQLQYIQIITDKTDAGDLPVPCGVFAILITVTRTKKYKTIHRWHRRSTNFVKNWQTVT